MVDKFEVCFLKTTLLDYSFSFVVLSSLWFACMAAVQFFSGPFRLVSSSFRWHVECLGLLMGFVCPFCYLSFLFLVHWAKSGTLEEFVFLAVNRLQSVTRYNNPVTQRTIYVTCYPMLGYARGTIVVTTAGFVLPRWRMVQLA